MTIVPWIRPHAVRLTTQNALEIWSNLPLTEKIIADLIKEQQVPEIIVAHRETPNGWPSWTIYNESEFCVEFETTPEAISTRFLNRFELI